jgi:hypothetical protein
LTRRRKTTMITHNARWSLPRGNTPVPSRWQATEAVKEAVQELEQRSG